jgi:multisubunit Na+/H+ antiporter MnhE subunit
VRARAELACWWLALTGGYLMLVSSPTGLEIPVGLLIGGLAALAAVAARRAFDPPVTVPSFVRRGVLLPLDLAADAVTLTWLLVTGRALRSACGARDEIELEDDPAVRAWAVLLTSASPGSLAADVEEHDGRLVLRRHLVTGHQRAAATLASR